MSVDSEAEKKLCDGSIYLISHHDIPIYLSCTVSKQIKKEVFYVHRHSGIQGYNPSRMTSNYQLYDYMKDYDPNEFNYTIIEEYKDITRKDLRIRAGLLLNEYRDEHTTMLNTGQIGKQHKHQYVKNYRKRHPEIVKQWCRDSSRRIYYKDVEKSREKRREYYYKNKQKCIQLTKNWQEKKKDRLDGTEVKN